MRLSTTRPWQAALLASMLASVLMALMPTRAGAGRDALEAAPTRIEIVVFEAPGCHYCEAFRERLGARYAASTSHHTAPLRYVDATQPEAAGFPLNGEIKLVPTIVVMQDGREVDRLEGYPLPEMFFSMIRSRL